MMRILAILAILFAGTAWGDTANVTVVAQSGAVSSSNATYLTARNATSGGSTLSNYVVGQVYSAPDYYVRRSFLGFVIPNSGVYTAASLVLVGVADQSTTDFDVNMFGARSYRSVFDTADFNRFNGWAASGAYGGTLLNNTWNSASYDATNTLPLAAAGIDSINISRGDTLWIALLSSRDVAATQPSGLESLTFEGGTAYLALTYTPFPSSKARSVPYNNGVLSPFMLNGVASSLK